MSYKIFVINTGSTSTKISIFQGEDELYRREITHLTEELKEFDSLSGQLPYRREAIAAALQEDGVDLAGCLPPPHYQSPLQPVGDSGL